MAAAEGEQQLLQAVSEAVAAVKERQSDLAAELATVQAELARARTADPLVDAPTPLHHIKTGKYPAVVLHLCTMHQPS